MLERRNGRLANAMVNIGQRQERHDVTDMCAI